MLHKKLIIPNIKIDNDTVLQTSLINIKVRLFLNLNSPPLNLDLLIVD